MFRALYLVFTAFAAACFAEKFGALPDGRIYGGSDTYIYDFPHQVSLVYKDNHRCGGSVYSENIVLTAAHCVRYYHASDFTVVAGSTFLSKRNIEIPVEKIIPHPNFRIASSDYDVAIVVLSELLRYRPAVQPIELAKERPSAGTIATLTGWGVPENESDFFDQLQRVDVSVVSKAECRKKYPILSTSGEMLCTAVDEGKYASHGDLGGPLIANNQLLGIVSWRLACGMANSPTVYASVPDLYEWIEDTASLYTISDTLE